MPSITTLGWGTVRALWWCFLFVVTLDIAARVDDWVRWRAPFGESYDHSNLVTSDSITLRGRAGYRFEKWAMNSHGFRGPELFTGENSRPVRVVTLGASETFGLFESAGGEYPARLQALLDSLSPRRFEVVNTALPGMSLLAMRPYLRHVVAPLKPDVVLVYPSPSFFLEISPPRVRPPSTGDTRERSAGAISSGISVASAARVRNKARTLIKQLVPVRVQLAIRQGRLHLTRSRHDADWVWTSVPVDRMQMFEEQLEQVVQDIEDLGAAPVLVTHSNRFLHRGEPFSIEDRQHLLAVVSAYWPRASEDVAIGVDSAANRRLRSLAVNRSVPIVETERRIPADAVHFADYSHFTDAGAARMAALIAEQLIAYARH